MTKTTRRTLCESYIVTNNPNEVVDTKGYFRANEFKSPDSNVIYINKVLGYILGELRDRIDEPIYINSGYRTPKHNKEVGGSAISYHMYGAAADIRAKTKTAHELYEILDNMLDGWGGLEEHKTFVHVDVRDGKWRSKL